MVPKKKKKKKKLVQKIQPKHDKRGLWKNLTTHNKFGRASSYACLQASKLNHAQEIVHQPSPHIIKYYCLLALHKIKHHYTLIFSR